VKKRPARSSTQTRRPAKRRAPRAVAAAPVTTAELRALRDEIDRRMRTATTAAVGKQRTVARPRGARPAQGGAAPLRWNPQPEDVQKSVAQLVLTIVEFLRRLMERQAIRRMEQKTLTRKEVEAVGDALMKLEETIRDIGAKFGLTPEDLNLDLGPLGKLM
jgi:gas vesicle protein GvpK